MSVISLHVSMRLLQSPLLPLLLMLELDVVVEHVDDGEVDEVELLLGQVLAPENK